MEAAVQGCEVCDALATDEPRVFITPNWKVTLASDQGYLGRAFVSASRHVGSLSELTPDEWSDLHQVIEDYESAITRAFGAVLFNWGCLMNNAFKDDEPKPHVHWHVRPRYNKSVHINGHTYTDPNFAHHYDSSYHDVQNRAVIEALTARIQDQTDVN